MLSTLFPSALPWGPALEPRGFVKERVRKRQPRGVDGSTSTLRSKSCLPLWSWPRFDFFSSAAGASSVSEVYFRTRGYKRSRDITPPPKVLMCQKSDKMLRSFYKTVRRLFLVFWQHHINSNDKHKTDFEPSMLHFLKGWFLFFFRFIFTRKPLSRKDASACFSWPRFPELSNKVTEHFNLREGKP